MLVLPLGFSWRRFRLIGPFERCIQLALVGALLIRPALKILSCCRARLPFLTSPLPPQPTPPQTPTRYERRRRPYVTPINTRGLDFAVEMDEEGFRRPAPRMKSIVVDGNAEGRLPGVAGPNSPKQPLPTERISTSSAGMSDGTSPTHRVSFDSTPLMSASPTKSAHSRSQSVMESPRRLNRLSMSFPVLPPNARPSRPTSWANSPVVSPTEPPPSVAEGNFLTQLASQERRVLELKEALRQAEAELVRLKKHWATHEALKKKGDVRRLQALQPISANLSSLETSEDDVDGSSQWLHKEMERRKALLSGIKTSNRKVFSGSRHTRTLSLLSPDKGTFSPSFPQPPDLMQSPADDEIISPSLQRAATAEASKKARQDAAELQHEGPSSDVLLRTGKQMATDIRDGLWTFFEDIRQATIGEEATMSPGKQPTPKTLKRANTTGTSSTSRKGRAATTTGAVATRKDSKHDALIDIGGSFWRDHGVETPTTKPASSTKRQQSLKKSASPRPHLDASDEPWDSWDTPIKSTPTSSSTQHHDANSDTTSSEGADSASDGVSTPLTDENSRQTPRTSTDRSNKRNSIPWPDLDKLTPSNLKRTASHLMREWEKSLTPSPGESERDGFDLLGSGKTNKSD